MKREYKGKTFEPLPAGAIEAGAELSCDLYVFLPLNARMVKIRVQGQSLDAASIASYTSHGHQNFYIQDGSALNAAQSIATERLHALEVPVSTEKIGKEFTVEVSKKEQASPQGEILVGKQKQEEVFTLAEKAPSTTQEVTIESEARSGKEMSLAELSEPKVQQAELESAALETEAEESSVLEEIPAPEKGGRAKKLEEEARKQFDAAIKNEKKKDLEAVENLAEEAELNFSVDEDEEESQAFSAEEAEKEALALVKGSKEKPDLSSTKITSEIKGIENEMRSFSSDAEAFVEEVRRIEADGAKETEDNWNLSLPEDSPKLRGLSKEEKSSAKLAFALGKKLGQLRAELNDNLGAAPKGEAEAKVMAARQKDLSEQIKKLEVTSMILESLDDKDIQVDGLPEELAAKSKLELLTHLEKNVNELTGSSLLDEAGSRNITKKIKKVKAMDFGVHGEKVDELSESLSRRRARMLEEGLKLDAAARAEVNAEVAKEVKAARIGAQATKELSAKRKELSKLLSENPKSKAETKANEDKARAIQAEIIALENISAAAEAGEDIAEEELRDIELKPDSDFELKAGENEAEAMVRIQGKLQLLKAEVVEAKEEAAEAQQDLLAKINGEVSESNEEKDPEAEQASMVKPVERLEKLGKLRTELQQFAAQKNAGAEPDETALSELHANAAKAVAEADALQKIDSKLEEMRGALSRILKEKPSSPEQKAKIEAMALKANAEIRELEVLQSAIENGTELPPGKLAPYLARKGSELIAREPGETAGKAVERLSGMLSAATNRIDESKKKTEATEKRLREEIAAGDFTELKIKHINTKDIEGDERQLSRMLKTFMETGKPIDSQAVWEVKKSVAAHAKIAKAGINVAKKVSDLGKLVKKLSEETDGGIEATEARKTKITALQNEIFELKKLGDSIDSGKDIDFKRISPFIEPEEEIFVVRGDAPSAEEVMKVIKSLGGLKDEIVRFRADALKTIDDVMVLKRLGAERKSDEGLKRIASGKDSKEVQAGIYAATFFRSFGYDVPELDLDIILAAYLGEVPAEKVAAKFPGRVAAFHGAQAADSGEMLSYDLGQAIRLARGYLNASQANKEKFALDPKVLEEFCKNPGDGVDFQLLERAKQSAKVPMPSAEKDRLIGLAEQAQKLIAKAKIPLKGQAA